MVELTRRGALAGLFAIFGAAATVSPVKAATSLLVSEPVVDFRRHIFNEMIALRDMQSSYRDVSTTEGKKNLTEEMTKRLDTLIGYMHDNIADKNPDIEDIQNLFRRQGLYENLPLGFDGFLMVPAASIPIVAARTLLSVFRVRFFPVNMHNWDRFAITYKNVIINS